MIDFLSEMMRAPEAQKDPHHHAATFGGHAWLGVGLWGVVAIGFDMWTAAWLVPMLYFVLWEGTQFYLAKDRTKALFFDCVLDAVAVAFGCVAAAHLGSGNQLAAFYCWVASTTVMVTGWKVRS